MDRTASRNYRILLSLTSKFGTRFQSNAFRDLQGLFYRVYLELPKIVLTGLVVFTSYRLATDKFHLVTSIDATQTHSWGFAFINVLECFRNG